MHVALLVQPVKPVRVQRWSLCAFFKVTEAPRMRGRRPRLRGKERATTRVFFDKCTDPTQKATALPNWYVHNNGEDDEDANSKRRGDKIHGVGLCIGEGDATLPFALECKQGGDDEVTRSE